MKVGKKDKFAIEFQILECTDGWALGTFLFWASGVCIGDPEDYAYLQGCRNWMRSFVTDHADRFEPELVGISKEDVFKLLWDPVYDFDADSPILNLASRFHIRHLGMSSFENFDLLLIEQPGVFQRLVWRDFKAGTLHDAYFPPGHIQSVAAECCAAMTEAFNQL